MSSQNITTLHKWDTTLNADSVEWCPVSPYHNIFVCGTYQLIEEGTTNPEKRNIDKTQQQKIGTLYLLGIVAPFAFRRLQTLELDGILDTKWCPKRIGEKILLGVTTAKGELLVYELKTNNLLSNDFSKNVSLVLLSKVNIGQEGKAVLALSLDWCLHADSQVLITISDSLGYVNLLKLEDSVLKTDKQWKLHEFESWIAAFDNWNPCIIYSGGDDAKFCIVDSRAGIENPVIVNKSHDMGVTSFHCYKSRENCLVSGSYDEKLRFWDTRNLKKPSSVLSLIGGIWRLKWEPNNTDHIIAACMYGGFCIISAEKNIDPKIVAIYKEHKDIAYGCDWSYHSKCDIGSVFIGSDFEKYCSNFKDVTLFATCSFYDHKLCVSVFDRSYELS